MQKHDLETPRCLPIDTRAVHRGLYNFLLEIFDQHDVRTANPTSFTGKQESKRKHGVLNGKIILVILTVVVVVVVTAL